MAFGYPIQYANGLNSSSQIRRSTDMIYQRGASYEVILTGSTYESSMELDVDLYSDDEKVGRLQLVPYDISQSGGTYTYKFNIRPYDYFSNYIKSEHYQYYYLNDWYSSNDKINLNNPYPNKIKTNLKYGYRYLSGLDVITEFTGSPTNNFNHYTDIPLCATSTGFTASGFTNTGSDFDLFGGAFQFDDRYILQNYDQEVGTVIGLENNTVNIVDIFRTLSPMSQYYMTYPSVPEQSDTGRFLTEAPRIQMIQENENYVLYYLAGQTGDRQVMEGVHVLFDFYDESNTLIQQFDEPVIYSGTSLASPTGNTDTLQISAIPCGPKDITNIFSTVDWSNIAYYRVQLYYGYSTNLAYKPPVGPCSETFYFYLYNNCLPENTRLVWLNSKGGYDYFTFRSYRQDTKKIERKTFDNRYYSTTLSSPDRNIGRTVKTFDTNIDQQTVLESEYLSDAYGHWLEELFISPQVYIMKDDFISPMDRQDKIYKDLTPVQVVSSEVERITKKHKKLNKYRITLKTANSFFVSKGF